MSLSDDEDDDEDEDEDEDERVAFGDRERNCWIERGVTEKALAR